MSSKGKKNQEFITVNGVERTTTNSKGQPIHHTRQGIVNFWRWFGDSKVVDEQGRPLVVYHGTTGDFDGFQNKYWRAYYFTDNLVLATEYAEGSWGPPSVLPLYLKIVNPYYFDAKNNDIGDPLEYVDVVEAFNDLYDSRHDGFLIKNVKDGVRKSTPIATTYACFAPNQIKSVNNDGTWDANDGSIISGLGHPFYPDIMPFPPTMPGQLRREILSWKTIEVSPFSPNSFYNYTGKTARYTKHGGLRVSNHWNVKTDIPVQNDKYWALGQYNANTGTYHILKKFPDKKYAKAMNILSGPNPNFYSTAEKALRNIQQQKGTPAQFHAMLLKNGAKQPELDWMGWDDHFVDSNKKVVTKQEIQDWIDQNRIDIVEVEKHEITDEDINTFLNDGAGKGLTVDEAIEHLKHDENITKYHRGSQEEISTELPGGENYKELLLIMPYKQIQKPDYIVEHKPQSNDTVRKYTTHPPRRWGVRRKNEKKYKRTFLTKAEAKEYADKQNKHPEYSYDRDKTFRSGHFNELNILAHVRFNERFDSEGNSVLFIEEIQSDWAQQGREKGFNELSEEKRLKLDTRRQELEKIGGKYRNMGKEVPVKIKNEWVEIMNELQPESRANKVPNMPFKQTPQWVNLVLRRMAKYAIGNGFDRIAWTTGEQQAERYDLSKYVHEITSKYNRGDDLYDIVVYTEYSKIPYTKVKPNKLDEIIGKELAKKLIDDSKTNPYQTYSGLDLKIGGEGMKTFYNQIVPRQAQKIFKKFGVQIQPVEISLLPNDATGRQLQRHERGPGTYATVLSFAITPKMRQAFAQGVPLYGINKDLFGNVVSTVSHSAKHGLGRAPKSIPPPSEKDVKQFEKVVDKLYNDKHIGLREGWVSAINDVFGSEVYDSDDMGREKQLQFVEWFFGQPQLPSKPFPAKNKIDVEDLAITTFKLFPNAEIAKPKPKNTRQYKLKVLHDHIASSDELRPNINGVYLNAEHNEMAATDVNRLLIIPEKIRGKSMIVDPKTGGPLKIKNHDDAIKDISGEKYPKYRAVMPDVSHVEGIQINLLPVLQQLKGIKNAYKKFTDAPLSSYNSKGGQLVECKFLIKHGGNKIYFDTLILLDVLTAIYKLGNTTATLYTTQPNRALTIKAENATGLAMPVMFDAYNEGEKATTKVISLHDIPGAITNQSAANKNLTPPNPPSRESARPDSQKPAAQPDNGSGGAVSVSQKPLTNATAPQVPVRDTNHPQKGSEKTPNTQNSGKDLQPWEMTRDEYEKLSHNEEYENIWDSLYKKMRHLKNATFDSVTYKAKDKIISKYNLEGGDYVTEFFSEYYNKPHIEIVKQALAEGRTVPPEVLADYPELQPNTPGTPAASASQVPVRDTNHPQKDSDSTPKTNPVHEKPVYTESEHDVNKTGIKILKTSRKGAMFITDGRKTAWIMPRQQRPDGSFTPGAHKALSESSTYLDDVTGTVDFVICETVKETEKAYLFEIKLTYRETGNEIKKEVWFPKSKITKSGNLLKVDKQFFNVKKQEIAGKETLISYPVNQTTETDKAYAIGVTTEEYLSDQSRNGKVFIPKSMCEVKGEKIIFPKWLADKKLDERTEEFKTGAWANSNAVTTYFYNAADIEEIHPEIIDCTPQENDSPGEEPQNTGEFYPSMGLYAGQIEVFVQKLKIKYLTGEHLTKSAIKSFAKEELGDNTPNDRVLRELTELTQVMIAEQIFRDTKGHKPEAVINALTKFYETMPVFDYRDSNTSRMQQFSTPISIAWVMAQYCTKGRNPEKLSVFEPSAGNGLLVSYFNPKQVTVNELDPARADILRWQNFNEVLQQDAAKPFEGHAKKYDVVMTNPPFYHQNDESKNVYYGGMKIQTLDQVCAVRALDTMKDDGRAAFILDGTPGNKLYMHHFWNENGELISPYRNFMRYLYSHYHVEDVIHLHGHKIYSRQGQATNLRIVLINGRRSTPNIDMLPPKYDPELDVLTDSVEKLYHRAMNPINRQRTAKRSSEADLIGKMKSAFSHQNTAEFEKYKNMLETQYGYTVSISGKKLFLKKKTQRPKRHIIPEIIKLEIKYLKNTL